jgi:hypothetical protein
MITCPHCHQDFDLGTKSIKKKKGPSPKPVTERFWSKVDIRDDNECWEWLASVNQSTGYGQFMHYQGRKPIGAHRAAYELSTGEVLTSEDFVCHVCDNRKCCNPKHLFKGDAKSNMEDMIAKGRMNHPERLKGADSPNAVLSLEQANEIRKLAQNGYSAVVLAQQFNVGRTTIGRVIRRENY